jgi:hypothetical protein
MKSRDWSDEAFAERRSRIKTPDALRAFDSLVAYGATSTHWVVGPAAHGYMKDFRFNAFGKSPFSFTCNQVHLLFYLRSAGVRVLRPRLAELAKQFEEIKERSNGEFSIAVRTKSEAARVISLILEPWLALNASENTRAGVSIPMPTRDRTPVPQSKGRRSKQVDEDPASLPRSPWSRVEVEATVADYFAMLFSDLAGEPYNKAARNRALQELLANRSQAAVELKHQNISAVLLELGCVYIPGYKPRGNYQRLLQEVVTARIETDTNFASVASQAVEREASVTTIQDIRGILVEPPITSRVAEAAVAHTYDRTLTRCDYLEREARNRSLGFAGEEFVATFEARRLHAGGHIGLSNRVEHVSKTQGDGLGYDVLSFEPSGKERFIEVKTTAFGPLTPFYVSRNELGFSQDREAQFILSRVHEFRTAPKVFELRGALRKNVQLEPVTYQAWL